jgi:hypothetical protein
MPSVIMLSVIMLRVVMLSVIMLRVVMLSVVMLNVVMQNDAAPPQLGLDLQTNVLFQPKFSFSKVNLDDNNFLPSWGLYYKFFMTVIYVFSQ